MEIAFLIIGIVIGVIAMWFVMKGKLDAQQSNNEQNDDEAFQQLILDKTRYEERAAFLSTEQEQLKIHLEKERSTTLELSKQLELSSASLKGQEKRLLEQKEEIEHLNQKFNQEFENIASKVLRINNEELIKDNKSTLSVFLKPLGEKIKAFENKIEQSGKEREGLKEQIKLLHDLNQRMAEETTNLTNALKGDAKKQGNWGEVILERVLERSGLTKGQEYETQYSSENTSGQRIQPDVIINLPENKHLVVDAKVSLVAFERLINAATEEERDTAIKDHIISVKSHVKGLSEKAYQTSVDLNTPDFVLLFLPIEASFSVAVQADIDIFNYAWEQKVVIVSPSTLLATLRTIASIWKQERQTKNALKIAQQSGALYDKFKSFLDDMEKINRGIIATQKSYDAAMNKLSTGTGNLINRANTIKQLGAKTSKEIDTQLSNEAEESDAEAS